MPNVSNLSKPAHCVDFGELLQPQLPNLLHRQELLSCLSYCQPKRWHLLTGCKNWILNSVETPLLVQVLHCLQMES